MIRYTCPHCQRACESADVLHGFTVFCLECRQPIKVPNESSLPDAAPPPPKPALPDLPKPTPPRLTPDIDEVEIVRAPVPPMPAALVSIPPAQPKSPPIPTSSLAAGGDSRRRLLRWGLIGVLALLLIGGGFYAWSWNSKRMAARARIAEEQRVESLKDTVRDNFSPDSLHRLAAKIPTWEIAPTDPPKLHGKAVVLSFTKGELPYSFWREVRSAFPGAGPPDDADLIREVLERGKVDELTFELPEERWAEGVSEAGTLVGIRWRQEVAGIYRGETLVDTTDLSLMPAMVTGMQAILRWRATVILLDRLSAKLTARAEFTGATPKTAPVNGKPATGPKPLAAVRDWLIQAEIGKPAAGR